MNQHAMTATGHAMPCTAALNKYQIQRITDEISQRLAILQREGLDVSAALVTVRGINMELVGGAA